MSEPHATRPTDLVALSKVLSTGDVVQIASVLFPRTSRCSPSRPPQPSGDESARLLAVHFLQRFAQAIEQGWHIDPDELPVLLNFLAAYQPDLRLKD